MIVGCLRVVRRLLVAYALSGVSWLPRHCQAPLGCLRVDRHLLVAYACSGVSWLPTRCPASRTFIRISLDKQHVYPSYVLL